MCSSAAHPPPAKAADALTHDASCGLARNRFAGALFS